MNKYEIDQYICLDLETTGLYYNQGAEIIELAAAKFKNGCISETFSMLCCPVKEIPEYITNITKIDNQMVENCKMTNDVIYKFMLFFDLNDITSQNILIHNASFDFNFIKYYTHQNFQNVWDKQNILCSLELSRQLYPNESHKLSDLKEKFKIKNKNHRALNDVFTTIKIFEKMKLEMKK